MNRRSRVFVAVLLVAAGSTLLLRAQSVQPVGTWAPGGAVAESQHAAAVTLADGRSLILGGVGADGAATDRVTLYDPVASSFTTLGVLLAARAGHSATLLDDGRVLVAGGQLNGTASAEMELFDPSSGASVAATPMAEARAGHAAARLPDGTVLIIGGMGVDGVPLASIELFDPSTGATAPLTTTLHQARTGATATTLLDGRVLVAGGHDGSADLRSAEIFDPWLQTFTLTQTQLTTARSGHTALLLPQNNAVLIAGGTSDGVPQTTTDLYLPAVFPDPYSYGEGEFAGTGPLHQPLSRAISGPAGQDGYAYVIGGGTRALYRFATIRTDKDDYAPGERALITGSGWQPGEAVTLLFQEDPAVHEDYVLTVTADAAGNIHWDQWAPEEHDLNVRFYLMAWDSRSRAQITFTDGNPQTLSVGAQTPASVTPGQQAQFTVSVGMGGNTATCTVTFSITTVLPSGATASFTGNPATVTNADFTRTLTIATTAATPPGTYPFTVRAARGSNCQGGGHLFANGALVVAAPEPTDSTPPVITPTVVGPLGENGWYVGDVTVSWNVADNESVITSSSGCGATTINVDTAGTTLTCTVTSAGGTSSASVTVKRDASAPNPPTAAAIPVALPSGWNNTDVTVSFASTGDNGPSGVAFCAASSTVTAETSGTDVSGTCTDAAGNVSASSTATVKIDKTPPAIVQHDFSPAANAAGWHNSDITVRFKATDLLSGPNASCQAAFPVIDGAGRLQTRTVSTEGNAVATSDSCTDDAGNEAEAVTSDTFRLDKTAPTISDLGPTSPANGAGWYSTPVVNRFQVIDGLSGLDGACLDAYPEHTVAGRVQTKTTSGEGVNVTVSSSACADVAGNSAAPKSSAGFNIDLTNPAIAMTAPADGTNTIVLSISVTGTASDALSGIAAVIVDGNTATYNGATGTWSVSGVALSCGANTITATATDLAGRSEITSRTVTRLCFTFEYLRPLEQSQNGTVVVNDGKYGRVIPVKGVIRRDAAALSDADLAALGLTLRIGVNPVACSGGAATDSVEEYADAGQSSGGTNLFRWTDLFWTYNLDTKAPAGVTMQLNKCYRLDAYVQDMAVTPNKVLISGSPYAIFRPVK